MDIFTKKFGTHLPIVWDKVPNKFGFFLTPPLIQNAEYNLKNSLKFKLLAFWRKKTPFIGQNCTYEKVSKIWAGQSPQPPHLDKIQKNSSFFRDVFL